jgi:BlaI family transcriptional regulator, penicillinase repressor
MSGHDIPAAELEVLACLKRLHTATAREIRETMLSFRPMAHGSVVTLLTRLEAKHLVTKEKGPVGKAFVYSVTEAAGTVYRNVLQRFLHRIFGGDSMHLVASVFETKPPDRKQVRELEQMVADLKAKARSK